MSNTVTEPTNMKTIMQSFMKYEWLSSMRKAAKPDINSEYFYFVKSIDIRLFSILQPKSKP